MIQKFIDTNVHNKYRNVNLYTVNISSRYLKSTFKLLLFNNYASP